MGKVIHLKRYYRFMMYLAVIVLINIAGATLFFRIDLTSGKVYSLSKVSKEAVANLKEPLTVKVFFTKDLPAPYNNIERYLHDLLKEYAISGNRYFNYQFLEISGEGKEEARQNQEIARNYGIHPVQVQNIEQDEVKFQMAHMGMVLIHGDLIEPIPTITSTEGLEFLITSTIRKMNNKISALIGLTEKVSVKLILSSSLQAVGPYMNLPGLAELPGEIETLVKELNEKNYGKLSFSHLDPSGDTSGALDEEAKRHNVLNLRWDSFKDRRGNTVQADKGYAGIIVQHGDRTEEVSLIKIVNIPIFGTQYILADEEELEVSLQNTVDTIIDINEEIGYLSGHGTYPRGGGEALPGQPPGESLTTFNSLLSREYTFKDVNLGEEGIPEGLPTLIIAGPRGPFSDYELYQIDQFLMKGRSLAIFLDSFNEIMPGQNAMMGQQSPLYLPLHTGLEKLLAHYGLEVKKSYVMDENCYTQRVPRALGGGERRVYFAPIIKNEFINKDVPFMKRIKGLIVVKASPVELDQEKVQGAGLKGERLFSSSEKSWEMSERINLNPMMLIPPQNEDDFNPVGMAYTLEGSFPSYFAGKPLPVKETGEGETPGRDTKEPGKEKGVDMSSIQPPETTIEKGKPGKIFLIGTSEILKNNILDEEGKSPNAQFVLNVIDYLNDREDFAIMRSKSQRFNPLREVPPGTRAFIKTANIAGLPVLVVLSGVIIWFRRMARKRTIQDMFRKG